MIKIFPSPTSPCVRDAIRSSGLWSSEWTVNLILTLFFLSLCLQLIYDSFAQFLVKEKGYDKELLTVTPEDWDFW